jgi:hypothetical protein
MEAINDRSPTEQLDELANVGDDGRKVGEEYSLAIQRSANASERLVGLIRGTPVWRNVRRRPHLIRIRTLVSATAVLCFPGTEFHGQRQKGQKRRCR